MVGKIIEGRYVGSEVHQFPGRNVLYIRTPEGQEIPLSKNNIISMDDVSSQYQSIGTKVIMVMWNNFEISILNFGNVSDEIFKEPVQEVVNQPPETHPMKKTRKNREQQKRFLLVSIICILAIFLVVCIGLIVFLFDRQESAAPQDTVFTVSIQPPTAEELAYKEAEKLLRDGETAKAAIAFGKLGNYMDARTRSFNLWSSLRRRSVIASAHSGRDQKVFLGIKNDGTVVALGTNQNGECAVQHWKNIVEVYSDGYVSCGLRKDGSIVLSDVDKLVSTNQGKEFQEKVETLQTWNNMEFLILEEENERDFWGLRRDGTVCFAGNWNNESVLEEVLSWTDIVGFYDCALGYFWEEGMESSLRLENYLGLRKDGTVVHAGENEELKQAVKSWTDIVKIRIVSPNQEFIIGWKSDGTIVTWGKPAIIPQEDLADAVDIVGSQWFGYAVLHKDGTVSTYPGSNDCFTEAANWQNVKEIYFDFHLMGLQEDGKVLTERGTEYQKYQPKSGEWTNIAQLYPYDISVGVRDDGTVCASEERYAYPLKSWTDIRTTQETLSPISPEAQETMAASFLYDENGERRNAYEFIELYGNFVSDLSNGEVTIQENEDSEIGSYTLKSNSSQGATIIVFDNGGEVLPKSGDFDGIDMTATCYSAKDDTYFLVSVGAMIHGIDPSVGDIEECALLAKELFSNVPAEGGYADRTINNVQYRVGMTVPDDVTDNLIMLTFTVRI